MSGIINTVGARSGIVGSDVYPLGHVIQTLSSTRVGAFDTTNTSATLITDLDVDIIPKFSSSKILVIASLGYVDTSGTNSGDALTLHLCNDSDVIAEVVNLAYGMTTYLTCGTSISKLDSPATTSSINYNVKIRSRLGANVRVDYHAGGSASGSSIIAMEIAQ
tara:strand:+ start:587 stop:1075 length:489 start_codon:yes stop_codon:yes gene_type:complete